jgi:predicted TPR repeat methyltransferase
MRVNLEDEFYVHAEKWNKVFNGFFCDPEVAAPFVEQILKYVNLSDPAYIVDLGGGDGFILQQLTEKVADQTIKYVNVDISEKHVIKPSIVNINTKKCCLLDFERSVVTKESEAEIMYIARSFLHYFGKLNLLKILKHIRAQMKTGEYFIHHSICGDDNVDADFMNHFFSEYEGYFNGSKKWVGSVDKISDMITDSGFEIVGKQRVGLPMSITEYDLCSRYKLNKTDISNLRNYALDNNIKIYNKKENIYEFITYIFICKTI